MVRPFLLLLATIAAHAQVTITYLANEGVMVKSGATKVLVDALFRDSLGDYLRHPTATQERLETDKAPFNNITLALATHFHLDHWDAGATSRFLTNNPAALFSSTPTGIAMLPRSQQARLRAPYPGSFDHAGLHVEAIPLRHGQIENNGFFVTQENRTWAHLGDAEPSPENFQRLLRHAAPEVAMVPFWWVSDELARGFLVNRWKPGHVIALHFGAADLVALRDRQPGIWYCTKPGESRTY